MEKIVQAMQKPETGVRITDEKKLIGPDIVDVTTGDDNLRIA